MARSGTVTPMSVGAISLHSDATSSTQGLSDDPRAKLMYYIDKVCGVLNLRGIDPSLDRYMAYHNYRSVDKSNLDQLLILANAFRPRRLLGSCLFINNQICDKAGFTTMTFPKVPRIERRFNIDADFVDIPTVGRIEITKVMVVKTSWLRYTFNVPYAIIEQQLQRFCLEEEVEEEEEEMEKDEDKEDEDRSRRDDLKKKLDKACCVCIMC